MKKPLLLLSLLLAAFAAAAQAQVLTPADSVWTRFTKKLRGEEHHGYQDARGRVRVPATLGGFTSARKFRRIIAANEAANLDGCYLLKNGRKVGRDSLYVFDYTYDCESEGKIRFRERQRQRVGFFDGTGRVVVPAVYNAAAPFYNGVALARIGARRACWAGGTDTLTCEHWSLAGGRTVLLNERNEILIDSLPTDGLEHLNWYSLRRNAAAPDTAISAVFRGVRGERYSVIDYEKEFARWLHGVFVPAVRSGQAAQVAALCFAELATAGQPFRGWVHLEPAAFVQQFYAPVLRPQLSSLRPGAENAAILPEELNELIFTSPRFQPFLTDCGAPFQAKYPVFLLVLSAAPAAGQPGQGVQTHFGFLRTAQGYRLISLAL